MFVNRGIFLQIRLGELEQRGGRPQPVFLKMHKRAGQLNQTFVKGVVRAGTIREPKLLKDIVRFEIQSAVEAFEKSKVMRVQTLALKLIDDCRNGAALFAHIQKLTRPAAD